MTEVATQVPATTKQIKEARAVLLAMVKEGRAGDAIEAAIAMLIRACERNSELTLLLEQLRKERSGRRTEKVSSAQLSLMLQLVGNEDEQEELETDEDLDQDDDADEDAQNAAGGDQSKKKERPRRRPLPKDLPRDKTDHELSENERACEVCDETMEQIGWDTSEMLEFVAAHFRVHEHRRAKYACKPCDQIKMAPAPDKAIEKGIPGTGLLAHVVVSKFDDHIPLNRQCRMFAREGIDIPVSTMCDWVGDVAELLHPVAELIEKHVLKSFVVQADGSGLKVLDRDDPEGIRRGTMWCYVGDRKWCLFQFAKTGKGEEGPWALLKDRTGYVQADAANVFDRIYNGRIGRAIEVGCNSHSRRRLFALKDTDPRVAYPLLLIKKLYKVERLADLRGLNPDQRLDLRKRRSAGIMQRLKSWVVKTAARENPESALHKACAYYINHWDALTRFLEDGRLNLDNNLCELQIRSLAVGRKNYLYAGSDAGAERAATCYTVLRTCALHGVDPEAYLKDVLDKLASGWPKSRMKELLPDAWAKARASPNTS
jgi:transposase